MVESYPKCVEEIKTQVTACLSAGAVEVFRLAESGAGVRCIELKTWEEMLKGVRKILSLAFALACRAAMLADVDHRGIPQSAIRVRLEPAYWRSVRTSAGLVRFPLFAYRVEEAGASVTRIPAREALFPFHRHCRSSPVCLEWEALLGAKHPFRNAEESLTYFTHGAVHIEDNTIARHMTWVGNLVERDWLFKTKEQFREILKERATRDQSTGKPIVYLSSDAHALRRYVDPTWAAEWKMANGLRVWCVDRFNGSIIHLGGTYTWGDCEEVEEIVRWLITSGHLPADGDYGDGLAVQVAVVVDGAEWLVSRVAKQFPGALIILDAYHLMEHIADFAATRFGRDTDEARAFYARALRVLFGDREPPRERGRSKTRKGHRKTKRSSRVPDDGSPLAPPTALAAIVQNGAERPQGALKLLYLLELDPTPESKNEAKMKLWSYVDQNAYRIDYPRYRSLGYQIGSGAMESLHRTASQKRLKVPGGRWLPETSQAILNLRMLMLSGRWNEFWSRSDLLQMLKSSTTSVKQSENETLLAACAHAAEAAL